MLDIHFLFVLVVFGSCQRECKNIPKVQIQRIDAEDNDGEYVQLLVTGVIDEVDNCEIFEKGVCVSTTKPMLVNGESRSSFSQHNTIQTTSTFEPGVLVQKLTLESRKKYYIWIYALSEKYAFYSSVEEFPKDNTISSNITLSNITASSVDVSVSLNSDYVVDEYGLCWSESQSPSVDNSHEVVGHGKTNGGLQSTISDLQSNTTYYIRAYYSNDGVVSYSDEKCFTTNFVCGTSTIKDYDGNIYNTVQIGNQCWMKENLRTTHYGDGQEITENLGYNPAIIGCYFYPHSEYSPQSVETYGYLYDHPAAAHSQNGFTICPFGWHLPTDEEWIMMEKSIGLTTSQANSSGYRGQVASKICEDELGLWDESTVSNSPGDYTASNRNATGFSAVPAGVVYHIGGKSGPYRVAAFWTRTWAAGMANEQQFYYMRQLTYDNAGIRRLATDKRNGYSVRCVKD